LEVRASTLMPARAAPVNETQTLPPRTDSGVSSPFLLQVAKLALESPK